MENGKWRESGEWGMEKGRAGRSSQPEQAIGPCVNPTETELNALTPQREATARKGVVVQYYPPGPVKGVTFNRSRW